jgi:hypothetical protein
VEFSFLRPRYHLLVLNPVIYLIHHGEANASFHYAARGELHAYKFEVCLESCCWVLRESSHLAHFLLFNGKQCAELTVSVMDSERMSGS